MIKDSALTKIKFSPVAQENLVIALDRLTRFKYPEIKYYRVFSDILCRYLLYPKLSKKQILNLDIQVLKKLFETIWNDSVKKYEPEVCQDKKLNAMLKNYICNTYSISDTVKKLVEVDININGVLSIAKELYGYDNLPLNLKFLIQLENNSSDIFKLRSKHSLLFPVQKVVLCEGITEEILLPGFASLNGYDFYKNGVKLIGAGGKNQVVKMYCELKEELKLPVFVLLDADAKASANIISSMLRNGDFVYLIKHGEFEDIFSLNLIKRTINNRYKNICESSIADFKKNAPMTKLLADFFRINELGDFQKAEFAKELSSNLKYKTDLTGEIIEIIEAIKAL